jgi:hypothetical protein
MRTSLFAIILGGCLTIGCDDNSNSGTTGTTGTTSLPSGSTVAPPPPVTSTTQPTTQPLQRDADDLTEQHRQNHKVPAPPETTR